MGFLKHTIGLSRTDLITDCLAEIRQWPGCETVHEIAILAEGETGLLVRVVRYGAAKEKVADQ
jgi:hypothetical protein